MEITFTPKQEKRITEYFYISIIIKGIISFAEMVAGVLALFIPITVITNIFIPWAQAELIEEPGDFIATNLVHLATQLSFSSGTFIAIYLFSRGFIKFALIVALFKKQLWAYPASLIVLGGFMIYQIYQIITTFSWLLILLTFLI